jgi:hemerythrin-like domain-containing protein
MSTRVATGTTIRQPDDAIALLTAEHRAIEDLFTAFEEADEHAHQVRRALVDRMITELTVHAAIEEAILYPAARVEDPGSVSDVLESLEEHHVVACQLRELVGMDPRHERFAAKVAVMMENVRHHIEKEEEDTLFPGLRTHASRPRLVELGRELQKMLSRMPGHPLPCPRATGGQSHGLPSGAVAHVVDRSRSLVGTDGN